VPSTTADLAFAGVARQAQLVRSGEVSSRELVEASLARIERLNLALNAVVTLDAERALRRARAADEARARGEAWGPLHGLPVGVKDCFETAGLRTTCGSEALAGNVPVSDAVAVCRLKAAGAIVLAKTNLPSFAMDIQTTNELFGTTSNPWDLTRAPAGSSGGSAAAVAAGMTPLELGSDLAGSIRLPSHACGVFGHKPSYGLVPTGGNRIAAREVRAEQDMTVAGPLARSARDLSLALDVLAGPSERRATAWSLEIPPPRARRLAGFRIATWVEDPAAEVGAEVREVLGAALERLAASGAKLDDEAGPRISLDDSHDAYYRLMSAALALGHSEGAFEGLLQRSRGPEGRAITQYARRVTIRHWEWLMLNERRERIRAEWAEFFEDFDAVVTPVAPTVAIPHAPGAATVTVDGRRVPYWDQVRWVGLASLAYLPATVVPAGLSRAGLPVGLQIIGPELEDRTPLELARVVEDALGGFVAPPV
jgi:amidase